MSNKFSFTTDIGRNANIYGQQAIINAINRGQEAVIAAIERLGQTLITSIRHMSDACESQVVLDELEGMHGTLRQMAEEHRLERLSEGGKAGGSGSVEQLQKEGIEQSGDTEQLQREPTEVTTQQALREINGLLVELKEGAEKFRRDGEYRYETLMGTMEAVLWELKGSNVRNSRE